MLRLLGCFGKLFVLLLLLAVVAVAWVGWPALRGGGGSDARVAAGPAPTPELAEAAAVRVQAAVEGALPTVSLSESEVTAILLHAVGARLPAGLTPTGVQITEGELRIEGRWELDRLPAPPWMERMARLLPDEVPVELRAALLPAADGEAILLLRGIRAGGIPVPRSAYATFLPGIGGGGASGPPLPPEAVRISLPPEVRALYIEEGRLILDVAR